MTGDFRLEVRDEGPDCVLQMGRRREELVPHLARHMDVQAIADAGSDTALSKAIGEDAAVNVKRVKRYAISDYFSDKAQGLDFIESFTEIKTTRHPIGV